MSGAWSRAGAPRTASSARAATTGRTDVADPRPLPVAWDGVPVEWEPFDYTPIHICPPPPPEPCPECGRIAPRATAIGIRRPVQWHGPLTAFRCTHCGHDQVYDENGGTTWDLDPLDYGPDGSWAVDGGGR